MSMILVEAGLTHEYDCQTASDLLEIDPNKIPVGSYAFVSSPVSLYRLNDNRVWTKLSFSSSAEE